MNDSSTTSYQKTTKAGSLVIKTENKDVRQSVSLPSESPQAKKKPEAAPKAKKYSMWHYFKFTMPFLWKGGFWIRVQTVLTFILLVISRLLNVTHPLILKYTIDAIGCDQSIDPTNCDSDHNRTYMLIFMYAGTRYAADLVNNIRELPFANVSAAAEIYIAHMVYNHIQH